MLSSTIASRLPTLAPVNLSKRRDASWVSTNPVSQRPCASDCCARASRKSRPVTIGDRANSHHASPPPSLALDVPRTSFEPSGSIPPFALSAGPETRTDHPSPRRVPAARKFAEFLSRGPDRRRQAVESRFRPRRCCHPAVVRCLRYPQAVDLLLDRIHALGQRVLTQFQRSLSPHGQLVIG